MGRGFLSGVIWGAILSGVVLAGASYLAGLGPGSAPRPEAGTVEVPPGSEFARPPEEVEPVIPAPETAPSLGSASQPELPPDDTAALRPPSADTDPLAAPSAGVEVAPGLAPPQTGAGEPARAGGGGDTARPTGDAGVPETSAPGSAPVAETEPVTAPAAEVDVDAGLAPPAPETADTTPAAGGGGDGASRAGVTAASPGAPAVGSTPGTDTGAPGRPETGAAAGSAGTEIAALPAPGAGSSGVAAGGGDDAVDTPARPAAPSAPGAPETPAAAPDTAPAAGGGSGGGVTVTDRVDPIRLPVPEDGAGVPTLPGSDVEVPAEDVVDADAPAIDRYGVPFEWDGAAPVMAVVLIDTGADRPDPAALAELPMPVSVALDPMAPGATQAMAAYRAAGVEVLAMTPLAEAAEPADVEVAFQEYFRALPETVAVLDMPDARLQASRPRATQVVEILAADGRGMVTWNKGLNAGLQIARRRGVPAAIVFREFDNGQRDVAAMKRFLDQAAFRAGQAGPVIVVGRTRPETLAALLEWALGTRAASLALAPVSAVLKIGGGAR